MPALLYALIGLLVVINVVVCIGVARSVHYSRAQKFVQILIVWAVPLLGALFVWSFSREIAVERRPDHYPDRLGADGGGYSQGSSFGHAGDIGPGEGGGNGH